MNKIVMIAALLALVALAPQAFFEKPPAEQRAEIQEMEGATLNELYSLRPAARNFIHESAGYAVFSTKGMKILIAGGTSGKGVLVDKETGKKIYMHMAQVNVGLGYGLQDARLIFVFQDRKAMEQFGSQGWDFSGQGVVSAAQQGQGANEAGAISFMPGVMVYQFTKNGLAASITLQGTKFWPNGKLN